MTLLVLILPVTLVCLLWLTRRKWELAGAGWKPFLNRLFGPGAEGQGVERGGVSDLADRALPHLSVTPSVPVAPPRNETALGLGEAPTHRSSSDRSPGGLHCGDGGASPSPRVYDHEVEQAETMPVWAMHFLLDLDALEETEERP